jgi:hypothetical protein
MARASRDLGLVAYDDVEKDPFADLSDEAALERFARYNEIAASFHLEAIKYGLTWLDKQPIPTHYTDNVFSKGKAPANTVLEVTSPNVAIPMFADIAPLIDFVTQDEYRRPLKRLREYALKILQVSASNKEIAEVIKDDMHDLERRITHEKVKRVIGTLKLIVGTPAGLAEDILKLRLESALTRPFTVAEALIDMFGNSPSYTTDPLYMAWSIRDELT